MCFVSALCSTTFMLMWIPTNPHHKTHHFLLSTRFLSLWKDQPAGKERQGNGLLTDSQSSVGDEVEKQIWVVAAFLLYAEVNPHEPGFCRHMSLSCSRWLSGEIRQKYTPAQKVCFNSQCFQPFPVCVCAINAQQRHLDALGLFVACYCTVILTLFL